MPERLRSARALAESRGTVIRRADLSRFDDELARVHAIHSRAWAENWGAVPLTREELRDLADRLLPVVDPDLLFLGEKRGEPVGVMISIPDVNQALRRLDGRLFPLGLARFLWYRRRIDAVRVLIMGVLAEHRKEGVDAALYAATVEAAQAKGYRWGELSWILESNHAMRRVLERLGTERYKTYRIYEKEL
jgi:GNAT superfamily N-acetyltransferase